MTKARDLADINIPTGDIVGTTDTQTLTNKTLTTPSVNNSATVGGSVKLLEAGNNGTNFVALKAPDALAADVTYVLPGTDGTNGQVLSTDGSGGLSWSSAAGGASIAAGDSSVVVTDTGTDGTIKFNTDGSERMQITPAGAVLIGGTTNIGSASGVLTLESTSAPAINLFRNDTSVSINDGLGIINFYGNDTTSNTPTLLSRIYAAAIGTHSAGDNPTSVVFETTPDGTETVEEAGRITHSGAYVLKGGTTNPGGVGITFPATQSASTNANTLDDYEEGTWTPGYAFATSGSATIQTSGSTTTSGTYTKIGRLVFVRFQISTASTSSPVGTVTLTGFPFAHASITGIAPHFIFALRFATDMGTVVGYFSSNSTAMRFYKNWDTTTITASAMLGSDFDNPGAAGDNLIYGELCYYTT